MKVLFLMSGNMWVHTLPEGFREAGNEVEISGLIIEKNFSTLISQFQPNLMISIGMGPDQTRERQLIIRRFSKKFKVPHIYWSIEDPWFTKTVSLPIIQTMNPDFVFSISKETVDYFNKMGIKSAYMNFGFAPKIHCHTKEQNEYKSSIAVVSNFYPHVLKRYTNHYRNESIKILIAPLLRKNIKIDFWGRDWEKAKEFLGYDIPTEYIHGYLPYPEANKVYSSAKIVIGLQNHISQVTQRTFEVLASEGLLLTNDTIGINSLFKNNEELITSKSSEDTVKFVQYYLEEPEERKKIAKNGAKAVIGNSYKERAEYMIKVLRKENII